MPSNDLPEIVSHMPSSLDVSWFIDMHNTHQLNLNPSYQRHSVWGLKDKRYFLDTIFRGYLCPPIYLHKTIKDGRAQYSVVDGKQRIETVLSFYANKLAMHPNFGNDRLNGRRWNDIAGDKELVERFMNFTFPVETINNIACVNDIFDRLNRNSKILNPQELRHAKYSGWLITFVENEANAPFWTQCKICSKGNARRMKDVQFISELVILTITGKVEGFDQGLIDAAYATYDDLQEFDAENDWDFPEIDEDEFVEKFNKIKSLIEKLVQNNQDFISFIKDVKHFYSLWAFLLLNGSSDSEVEFLSEKYSELIVGYHALSESSTQQDPAMTSGPVFSYYKNSIGASTEAPQRMGRQAALVSIMQ